MPETSSTRAAAAASFALIAVLESLAIYQLQPPSPASADAPATEFAAFRALEHLRAIARRPHPTGSPENAEVRTYIVNRLRELGLEPRVQTATVSRFEAKWRGPVLAATVNNIVARLYGTASTRAIMLAAHYDSVPSGPGASDDGSGTATLLETARALRVGPAPRNDVIFLFTDGEELGLLGAKAFVDDHPWSKDVGVALNFEARGACGPSLMFETSPGGAWLIREFAKATAHPATSSFMYEGYKRLPNDTDFTVFKRAGMQGLNFAYTGCWPRYHTRGDSVENLDPRSLQHHGYYALALARHLGDLALPRPAQGDLVYFSLFSRTLHYSRTAVVPVMLLSLVAFGGALALGFKRGQVSSRGITLGAIAWLAGAVLAATLSEALWLVLRKGGLASRLPHGIAYNSQIYALAFVASTIAITAVLHLKLREKVTAANLIAGALMWWALFAALTGLALPGGSYLFAWPLLASSIALGYTFARNLGASPQRSVFAWAVPATVGILLFGPIPYLLLLLLSTSGLVPLTVSVALLLGLLAPHLCLISSHRPRALPAVATVAATALIVAGAATSGYNARQPRADSIFYVLNTATDTAVWATTDLAPDAWTSQFLSGATARGRLADFLPVDAPILTSPAPKLSLPAPKLVALDDVTIGDERFLQLWISSPRRARAAWLLIEGTSVLGATIDGKPVASGAAAPAANWSLLYTGLPAKGLLLTLRFKASESLTVRLADQSDGLPEVLDRQFTPRPDEYGPAPFWPRLDSSTLVTKTFQFEASP